MLADATLADATLPDADAAPMPSSLPDQLHQLEHAMVVNDVDGILAAVVLVHQSRHPVEALTARLRLRQAFHWACRTGHVQCAEALERAAQSANWRRFLVLESETGWLALHNARREPLKAALSQSAFTLSPAGYSVASLF